jgi:hypothetical protein
MWHVHVWGKTEVLFSALVGKLKEGHSLEHLAVD